jgi:BASS family bile acid:Na+ symporter
LIFTAVKIGGVTLAVSPVPPVLPRKQGKAGGREAYAIGLLVAAGLLAIVFVPIAVELVGRGFGTAAHHISFLAVARLVLITVFGRLLAGIVFRSVAPALAERISQPMSLIAMLLLVSCAAAVLFSAWPALVSLIGNGTIVALAAFVIIGLSRATSSAGPATKTAAYWRWHRLPVTPGLPSPLPARTFQSKSSPRLLSFCI